MKTEWDYIVIGAGHNGLSAACTLASEGKSVIVLDQRDIIGGLSASHNYLEKAPEHLLSIGAMDDAFYTPSSLAKIFQLERYGYQAIPLEQPYGWMNEAGESLLLFSDFNRAVDEIRYFSPDDAARYIELRSTIDFFMASMDKFGAIHPNEMGKIDIARTLLKLATDKSIKKNLGRMLSVSAFEMIAESFQSEAMRGLWAFWVSMSTAATQPGTGIFLSAFGNVHRSGIFRPKGGMTGMMSAFARLLNDRQGVIELQTAVDEILVNDGRAIGVRLGDGTELQARDAVLASCAPQVTFGKLLPEDALDQKLRDRIKFIPANSIGVAPYKIDLATSENLAYTTAQTQRHKRDSVDLRKTTFMTGTLEEHMTQHDACQRGEFLETPSPLYFSILSAADPSIAPAGGDVLYLYGNVPVSPREGWQDVKQSYGQSLLNEAKQYIEGLDSEIDHLATCPDDFIADFSAPNGSYFHVDSIPSRMGMNRPAPELGGYQTPIEGLYIAGSGAHPGGGVTGLPGRLAAEMVLKQVR